MKHEASRPTSIPAFYSELVDEMYLSIAGEDERPTEIPPASVQMTLELECAGLEVE